MTDSQEAPPDTGSLEGDLRAILAGIADLLGTARWSSILPSIVDAAEHDPEFAGIHSRIQHGHAAPLRAALGRAALRGEIPPAADRNAIAAALLGPLFYRRWFSRETDRRRVRGNDHPDRPCGPANETLATRSQTRPPLGAGPDHREA
jgi:hypothetical protein